MFWNIQNVLSWWSSATKVSGHQNRMFLYVSIALSFPSKGWRIPLLMFFWNTPGPSEFPILFLRWHVSFHRRETQDILQFCCIWQYFHTACTLCLLLSSLNQLHLHIFFLQSFSGLHTHTNIYFHFNSSYLPVMFSEKYGRNTEFPLDNEHTCHIFIRI